MHSKAVISIAALAGTTFASPVLPQTNAPQSVTKEVDCKAWDTPYSCDIFCFATLCMDLPATLSHSTHSVNDNRKQSGNTLGPFNDRGIQKYNTWRRDNTCTWADEYPVASSLESGDGVAGSGRAIIQGATPEDQQGQLAWVKRIWEDVPEAAKITLSVANWDSKLSPYCDAWKAMDKTKCTGNANSPYFRLDDGNNGKNGAKTFSRLGT